LWVWKSMYMSFEILIKGNCKFKRTVFDLEELPESYIPLTELFREVKR
jgi:hypothetical protein